MGFPRQGYWNGLPFPSPENLPDPRTEPESLALAGGLFTVEPPGEPCAVYLKVTKRVDLKILITRKKSCNYVQ